MNTRRAVVTVGAGITSALLVGVLVTELLALEFSALVGLPLGVLAGVAVAVWLRRRVDGFGPTTRRVVAAYASFGATVLALSGLGYANVGRGVLSLDVVVGGSLAVAVAVYAGLAFRERS